MDQCGQEVIPVDVLDDPTPTDLALRASAATAPVPKLTGQVLRRANPFDSSSASADTNGV